MKILYITQLLPVPQDTGGKIKTFQTIKLLAQENKVHLVCFVPSASELKHRQKLEKVCASVRVFVWPKTTANYRQMVGDVFFNLFSRAPFTLYRYSSPEMHAYLDRLLRKEEFDIIWIDHLNMAQYLPRRQAGLPRQKKQTWVLEEHNIESSAKASIVRHERSIFKFIFAHEATRLWFYERKVIPRFDYWLAISRPDRQALIKRGANPDRAFFLPTPFAVKPLYTPGSKEILFIGLLSWWPNKDGFAWFYQKVFPPIRKKLPQVKFVAVGAQARPFMEEAAARDPNLILPGYVAEIEPYLAAAGVFVVPLRMGGGIRIKILTAMAAGVPVVATTKAAEGIEVTHGKNILLADTPEEFARQVVRILTDRKLAQRLSQGGKKLIKDKYNKESAARTLRLTYATKAP